MSWAAYQWKASWPRSAGAGPAFGPAAGQGPGVGGVQGAALAREQVVVERLLDQGMPEAVGVPLLVGDQQVAGDRLAQQPEQPLLRHGGHGSQQLVVDLGAGRRGHPQHLLGLLGQGLHPGQQQVAQGRGQLGPPRVGGQQLLGEERVALRAGQDVGDQPRRGRVAEDPGHQTGQLGAGERVELQALGAAAPFHLGQERPQRVAGVQLVGAVGEDRDHPGPEVAQQELEQVEGGPVGPVQVLDHHQDRAPLGQAVDDPEQQLEQPPRRGRDRHRRGRAQLGHEAGQLRAGAAEHRVQLVGPDGGRQRPQGLHHRRVRQDAVADVEAAAGQHHGAGRAGLAGELGDQPGLAHPGLAGHHDGDRLAGRGALQRRPEPSELGGATDQDGAGDHLGHATDHARRRS